MPRDGIEIGSAEKPVRRKRAMQLVVTGPRLPASAHIGGGNASGDDGAENRVDAITWMPHVANIGAEAGLPAAEPTETGARSDLDAACGMPPSQIIDDIRQLQRQRVFAIKSQSRCDRSCEAFIARYLGYASPREKIDDKDAAKAGKALFAKAAAMRRQVEVEFSGLLSDDPNNPAPKKRRAVEKGGDALGGGGQLITDGQSEVAPSACVAIIVNSALSRRTWDKHRTAVEREMRRLAKSLPVYAWAAGVKGFGDLGLAIIVGETGDLWNYATKERVWKRLGLAVIDGERQQRRSNVEQAGAHGYSPRRRAEIWTLADSMFRHQWRGAKDGREAGPAGPYGEVYQKRKAHTATREWTLAHREQDARRVMTKALVEDLWKAWRRAEADI